MDIEHEIILYQLHDEGKMLYGVFIAHVQSYVSLPSTCAWMILCLIFVGFQTCFLFYFVVFRSTVLHSKEESVKTTDFIGQLPAFVLDAEVTEAVASAMSSPNLS